LGVNEDDVFADYYAMNRTSSMPPLVVGRKKTSKEFSPGPWIAFVIVVIAAAAVYWWFVVREPITVEPVQQSSAESDAPVVLAAMLPGDEPSTTEDSAIPEPLPQLPPDGHVILSLSYSGDCWTEINDADGNSLYIGMARDGRTMELTGRAPISALFGDADNVSVQVNGGNNSVPAPTGANRRVRLTIPSP
jgi:cytoskeletal protein RodZ